MYWCMLVLSNRFIRLVLCALLITVLVGTTLKAEIPINPNYNYIQLWLSEFTNDSLNGTTSIEFTANATGFSYAFNLSSSVPPSSNENGISGFDIYYLNTTNASIAVKEMNYLVNLPTFSQVIPSFYTTPLSIDSNNTQCEIKSQTTGLADGYYFFHIGYFVTTGSHRNFVQVHYKSELFDVTGMKVK